MLALFLPPKLQAPPRLGCVRRHGDPKLRQAVPAHRTFSGEDHLEQELQPQDS